MPPSPSVPGSIALRPRIKICCIASDAEAQMAIEEGADAVGLVARMPSGPGPISDEAIMEIAANVPPPIASFLLTSEVSAAAISDHIDKTRPNTVQIVSHIAIAEAQKLAVLQPQVRRVQVIHVEDVSALELIDAYAPFVHAFLLDSGRPSAGELGGTGRVHDWSVSRAFVEKSPHPVFLAGGLSAENVKEALRVVRPFGLDLCSSVRTDNRLDRAKLRAFMAAAGR